MEHRDCCHVNQCYYKLSDQAVSIVLLKCTVVFHEMFVTNNFKGFFDSHLFDYRIAYLIAWAMIH